jgi:ADP-heptose:LPS heptosyltransferase
MRLLPMPRPEATRMPNGPRRILVIKLSALGDFILALGPMEAIRLAHENAHITLLTTRPYEALARASGYFDDIWLDTRPRWFDLAAWRGFRRRLKIGRFDRVYDLQTNDRTGFYHWALMFHRPEWSGTVWGASHRVTDRDFFKQHTLERHARQLALAGIGNGNTFPIPELSWFDADIARFDLPPRFALLVPGSAPHRPEKRWPPAGFAALAAALERAGLPSVLVGTAADRSAIETIRRAEPSLRDLSGQTNLFELAALARRAAVVIGNDTGPMHIAAALGAKTIVLFSAASNPALTRPRGRSVTVLGQEKLADLRVETVLAAIAATPAPPRAVHDDA